MLLILAEYTVAVLLVIQALSSLHYIPTNLLVSSSEALIIVIIPSLICIMAVMVFQEMHLLTRLRCMMYSNHEPKIIY